MRLCTDCNKQMIGQGANNKCRKCRPLKTGKKSLREAAYDRLLKAAGKYVDALGGYALVGGGVEIQQWPDDPPRCFRVAVKITGRKPVIDDEPQARKPR